MLTNWGTPPNPRAYRTELTPISFLRRSASVFPDRTAVVHGERRYSYRQLEDRVDRLVRALHAAGLERGDRVAFLSPNTPALLEAHYGVPAAGGVLVAINTRLNSEEVGYILGHDLAVDRRTVRSELALVGHAPGAYDDLTVRENVRFWVRAGGGGAADADAVLEQLGLTRLAGVAFGRLSAGQQRRTGLAVALARRPRLLLLDEPHAGLDATGRDLLDGLLRGTARDGRTVLIVSHELDRARALADREVTIVAGSIRPIPSEGDERSGDEALPHRAHPDQLPPPERVGLPRPHGGGPR